jgi:hypothetical protein
MPKKTTDSAAVARFERAIRKALRTPADEPMKKKKARRKKKARA